MRAHPVALEPGRRRFHRRSEVYREEPPEEAAFEAAVMARATVDPPDLAELLGRIGGEEATPS